MKQTNSDISRITNLEYGGGYDIFQHPDMVVVPFLLSQKEKNDMVVVPFSVMISEKLWAEKAL